MAVPKKRTSKSKKNSRLSNWSKKAGIQAKRALSLAKSILTGQPTSFISNLSPEDKSKTS
jgi:large subunit ribosomal protein L32